MIRNHAANHRIRHLSPAGLSMLFFGIILLLNGVLIALYPEMFFRVNSHSHGEPDVATRMFAMLSFYLGYYYIRSAFHHKEMRRFYIWTVQGRMTALVFFIAFVIFDIADPGILIIPAIDYAGAIWTYLAVRREEASEKRVYQIKS